MFSIKPYASLLALLLVSACISPEGKQSAGIDLPGLWNRLGSSTPAEETLIAGKEDARIEQDWWKRFRDPVLDTLVAEALKNNKTLAIAKARVAEVRANRLGARAALLPQVDGVGSTTRGNRGSAGFFGGKPLSIHEAGFQASWELDLFGKNQARAAEAAALLESEEALQGAVRVSLLAEVARTYYDYRNAEWQIAITEKNLTTQKRTLELTQAQLQGALASGFDVERAGAQVATTAAMLPALYTQRDAARNRLNVLLGQAPGTKDSLLADLKPVPPLNKRLVIAAPASVIAMRPDVQAAERRFAATLSASRSAWREIFPNISLLAFYGVQDAPFGAANPWSLGASLVQPILNFGTIESHIDAADAREKQAFLLYQQTVLEALEDMENALSGYLNEASRRDTLAEASARNRKAVSMARDQYKSGYAGLIDVLVVERDALAAESALATSDAQLRQHLIDVYTAAGGGWQDVSAAPEKKEKPAD